ncbi:unnamed protein product [Mytilus edulis]|uniref:Glycosyltransferase family 92 protein n=1 Tax=Mytilus edulis TaxID=6550 RepID=A0A8S3RBS1_MYTED|nr:unnamed protein product [Mytilus edulis]
MILKQNQIVNILKIESCSDTVHIFSAVAQAKKDLSKIEFVVLNVLDGSNHSNCDCCIYGEDKLSIHRQNAIVKEKYAHNSIFADLIASQYRCFVRNIRFKIKHIQLIGKEEFCNSSDVLHPVIYASVKENKIAICAKIAYNYLNPLHLIEWFEYQIMMGVDTVLISLQQVNEDAHVVLNHYEKEGLQN